MRRIAMLRAVLMGTSILIVAGGCRSGGAPILEFFGIIKKPVVVALVDNQPATFLNPFGSYEPLREALGDEIGRPVALELPVEALVEPNLKLGIYHLAVVSAAYYARLNDCEEFAVMAIPADAHGRLARPALLVVAPDAEIQAVADLRGKRIAFGPKDNARTHLAALKLLEHHGIAKKDLSLELLPIPGSLKHMPRMRAVAQEVIAGDADAGFIDEAAWEGLPDTAAQENEPARDKLRVISRTEAIPDRLLLRSPKLDAATTAQIETFLLSAHETAPGVLRPLKVSAYQSPSAAVLELCAKLVRPAGAPKTAGD